MILVLVGFPALFWGEKTFKNRGHLGFRVGTVSTTAPQIFETLATSGW